MRARILILVATGLLLAHGAVAQTDETGWQRALIAGETAYRNGDYTEAAFAFGLALKTAEGFGELDSRVATSLGWLAETYRLQGRLGEAEPLLKRALVIRERLLGPVHPSTHMTRHNLAALQKALADAQKPAAPAPAPAPVAAAKPKPPPPPPRAEEPKPQPPAPPVAAPKPEPAPPPPLALLELIEQKPKAPPLVLVELIEQQPKAPPLVLVEAIEQQPKAPPLVPVELVEQKPKAPPLVMVELVEQKAKAPPPPPPAPIARPEPKPTPPALEVVEMKPKPAAPPPIVLAEPKPKPQAERFDFAEAKPAAPALPEPRLIATPVPDARSPPAKPAAPPPAPVAQVAPKPAAPAPPPVVEPKPQPPAPKLESVEMKPKPPTPTVALPPPKPTPVPAPTPVAAAVVKPAPPAPQPLSLAPPPVYRSVLAQQLAVLATGARGGASSQAPKAFELMQRARLRSEGGVSRVALRLAPGDEAVARAARERQSLYERMGELDRTLTDSSDLERRIAEQDAVIDRAIPAFRDHLNPAPVALAAAQALLAPDEALLAYFVDDQMSHLVVARRDRAALFQLRIGRAELAASVKRLRASLDPSGDAGARGQPPAFPAELAHRLYADIIAPAASFLDGAAHLLVVPDDTLQSLPFAVLVTEPYTAPPKDETARPAWLARRYAVTLLPSEGSLQALRRNPTASASKKAFAGFGDPMLLGDDRRATPSGPARLFGARDSADVNLIRDLVRMPETRYMLDAMSDILNGDPRDVRVEADANETGIKQASLAEFRVLAFATYGLMAGDFPGAAEPGLVFTPPAAGSTRDDGLLTASEVAQLRLDAELVVLPSSSTATADGTPGVEGLPRLSRAFLHAGGRSLVVSHWAVASDSTLKLLGRMLRERSRGAGNAEALRRSMLALMDGEDRAAYTHPMYWAPLVVVGEGARGAGPNPSTLAAPATRR